jgi:hypothetical protein
MEFNSTEQTIGWFRDRYAEGSLTIRPPYQRKPVWKARQKCYLIESILMGLPIPEIYVHLIVSADEKVIYAVVDGQQRIRTILQFIGAEQDPEEQEYNKFALDMLPPSSTYYNLTYARLTEENRRKFIGHRLAVRTLTTGNEDEIREMFTRLNKYLTPLKAQELRNATYSGPFLRLVSRYADDQYWTENRIVTTEAIRRMGDVEFVSELLIGLLHGPQGGSSSIIDEYYAQYEDYEDEFPEQKTVAKLFEETLKSMQQILPDIKGTRWGNKSDFYSLFVGLGSLLATGNVLPKNLKPVRDALIQFAGVVNLRRLDENANVSKETRDYLQAVEKGANDKSRRAERHAIIVRLLEPFFVPKRPR